MQLLRRSTAASTPPPGLADDDTGPVEAKLAEYGRVRGFVFGAAGELSPDLMQFVADTAEMGAAKGWREMGARRRSHEGART